MIDIIPEQDRNVVNIPVSERLDKQDYELFVPRIDGLVKEHGKLRILFDLDHFNGWKRGGVVVRHPAFPPYRARCFRRRQEMAAWHQSFMQTLHKSPFSLF